MTVKKTRSTANRTSSKPAGVTAADSKQETPASKPAVDKAPAKPVSPRKSAEREDAKSALLLPTRRVWPD